MVPDICLKDGYMKLSLHPVRYFILIYRLSTEKQRQVTAAEI